MVAEKIGDLLVRFGLLDGDALQELLSAPASTRLLGERLVIAGLVSEETLFYGLSLQTGVPWVRFGQMRPQTDAVAAVPQQVAIQLKVVPLVMTETQIIVATPRPRDTRALGVLAWLTKREVLTLLATEKDVRRAFGILYETTPTTQDDAPTLTGHDAPDLWPDLRPRPTPSRKA